MTYVDTLTETRVVFSLLTEPFAFDVCADLGLPDLTDYRLVVLLTAIRSVPNHADAVTFDAVENEIRIADLARGTRNAEHVSVWWLAEQVLAHCPYRGHSLLLEHDLWWLRELSNRRATSVARAA